MSNPDLSESITLVVSDIEGCLSPGKRAPLNCEALAELQRYNGKAKSGRRIPLTLCTGRPQPFVEVFCQMLSIGIPCVCENGAFLYDAAGDKLLRHPEITDDHLKALRDVGRLLAMEIMNKCPHQREPGKEICISLNPVAPQEEYGGRIESLYETIAPYLDSNLFNVTHSASAVDITPNGIDKAAGVRFLASVTGVPPKKMLGIGDTAGDLPFLRISGLSATPSNGSKAVKETVHYTSSRPDAEGVLDIIEWVKRWEG